MAKTEMVGSCMQTLTAKDAKYGFGRLIDLAPAGDGHMRLLRNVGADRVIDAIRPWLADGSQLDVVRAGREMPMTQRVLYCSPSTNKLQHRARRITSSDLAL